MIKTKEFSVSIDSAFTHTRIAQACVELLDKLRAVLKYEGRITLHKKLYDDYIFLFTGGEPQHIVQHLKIDSKDPLIQDMYVCLLVRIQEKGGINALPCGRG